MHTGLKAYQDISVQSEVFSASAHRLIQMLFEGCLQRIALAKIHIQQNQNKEKIRNITKAIDIVMALRSNLIDLDSNPISQQLDNLYEFVEHHLTLANLKNSCEILDQAYQVIATIKSGWDALEHTAIEKKEAANY